MRTSAHRYVEKALYAWLLEVRVKLIKAKWFAAALGETILPTMVGGFTHVSSARTSLEKPILAKAKLSAARSSSSR